MIGLLIVPRAWGLLHSVVDVLLEAAPRHLDMQAIEAAMREVPGVESVHDLHVWTITSGFVSMSGHVRASGSIVRGRAARPAADAARAIRASST